LAHIYLGTLDDAIQFIDPADQNNSVWKASRAGWNTGGPCGALPASTDPGAGPVGTENLVACNGFAPAPVTTSSLPVMISAPRAESLAGAPGFEDCSSGNLPVVIYQHGITSNRATLMAIADTLASQCIVGVAIDLPKHGILPTADATVDRFGELALLQAALSGNVFQERLVKVSSPVTECQATSGVAIPADSDFYCPSGDNFINLTNLANARDALRQGSVDLHSLFQALEENAASDLTAATIGTTVDTNRISFLGMSLGGIVGASFVAQESDLTAAILNVAGGGVAKILDGSPSFEPSITAGLYSAAGLMKPSGSYEGFMIIAQAMIDNVDPINFATTIASNGTPVMLQEVIGDPANPFTCLLDGSGCSDQVVPNNTFGTSFGPAWGLVAQTGQTGFLANQNFITTPVALSGSDPLAQGTGFIVGASIAAANPPLAPNVVAAGPLGQDLIIAAVNASAPGTFPAGTVTFKGLSLPTVTSCGENGGGVVRYTSGAHSSLLDPTDAPAVTQTMQSQVAGFVLSNGTMILADSNNVVFDPAAPSASQAACIPSPP
jgi:dienelactone hydrolase